jgi:hypothetical protein
MDHHYPMLLKNDNTRPHVICKSLAKERERNKRKEAFVFNALPETPMLRSSPLLGFKN